MLIISNHMVIPNIHIIGINTLDNMIFGFTKTTFNNMRENKPPTTQLNPATIAFGDIIVTRYPEMINE